MCTVHGNILVVVHKYLLKYKIYSNEFKSYTGPSPRKRYPLRRVVWRTCHLPVGRRTPAKLTETGRLINGYNYPY